MRVTIMYRNSYEGGDGWGYYPLPITISDLCHCGAKRGNPKSVRFYEDGEWFETDRWENPCGHLDKYEDCFNEFKRKIGCEQ